MERFVEGEDRRQATLLPDCLDDYVTADNPVRVVDVFIDELDLGVLDFAGVVPEATGRPAYHPATLLKIYLNGYLNRIQSSRRLERESQRNIELMWLTGRLMPDFKTIADFRRDNGPAIRAACAQFVVLCRSFNLFTRAVVALDGSRFKAVNNRDKNFTVAKVAKRIEQVEVSIGRYLAALDRADRQDDDVAETKTVRLKEKIEGLRRQMQSLKEMGKQVEAAPDKQVSLTDPDARSIATSGKGTGIVGCLGNLPAGGQTRLAQGWVHENEPRRATALAGLPRQSLSPDLPDTQASAAVLANAGLLSACRATIRRLVTRLQQLDRAMSSRHDPAC